MSDIDVNEMKWHKKFLRLAREYSTSSKDPSTQIGAVAVKNRRPIAFGYNGFPSRIEDTEFRLHSKPLKYARTIHGEMNVIYNAAEEGVKLRGSDLYIYGLPLCSACSLGVIQVGFDRVFMHCPNAIPIHWQDHWALTKDLLDESGVKHFFIPALD